MGKYKSNYNLGIKGENYFASLLNAKGIQQEYTNSWFDFTVWDNKDNPYMVEVKSTSLLHANKSYGNRNSYSANRIGRFQFSLGEARKQIFSENIWICFIIEYRGQFILLGLCRAEKLKNKRFVSLCELEKAQLLDFDEWVQEIMK